VPLPLLLASASPRRRELLERVGVPIEIQPANIDESTRDGELPEAYVARLARAKATSIPRQGDRWVLAADTTVALGGTILGKAESPQEAADMLRGLSGRTHRVWTAFALLGERDGRFCLREGLVASEVVMIELDTAIVADYIASGEWRGKAGAYAIQGMGAALVRAVHGSVTNVAGLPLAEVLAALREVGAPLPRFIAGNPA
jgi:septum formation protein